MSEKETVLSALTDPDLLELSAVGLMRDGTIKIFGTLSRPATSQFFAHAAIMTKEEPDDRRTLQ